MSRNFSLVRVNEEVSDESIVDFEMNAFPNPSVVVTFTGTDLKRFSIFYSIFFDNLVDFFANFKLGKPLPSRIFCIFSDFFSEANERIQAILAGYLNFTTMKYLLTVRMPLHIFFYLFTVYYRIKILKVFVPSRSLIRRYVNFRVEHIEISSIRRTVVRLANRRNERSSP